MRLLNVARSCREIVLLQTFCMTGGTFQRARGSSWNISRVKKPSAVQAQKSALAWAIVTIRRPCRWSGRAPALNSTTCRSAISTVTKYSIISISVLNLASGLDWSVNQAAESLSYSFGLLQRFYDVQKGSVVVDGQDIAHE